MGKDKHADIFVSYSHKDRIIVQAKILKTLTQCSVWWDGGGDNQIPGQQGIDSGVDFTDAIEKAIENCKVFLFALSRNSLASEWCLRELDLANKCGKEILPILIEPGTVDTEAREAVMKRIREGLPPEIRDIHWLDLSGKVTPAEKTLERLLRTRHLCRRRFPWKCIGLMFISLLLGVLVGLSITEPQPPVEPILRALVDREIQAVLSADSQEIAAIYIDNAIVEDADPNGRIWYDAISYYAQNRINLFYCRAEHNDFEIVVLTDNYARATTSSEGAFGLRSQSSDSNSCPNTYNNPRGADIWEFVRDESNEWRISRFTFNAHQK